MIQQTRLEELPPPQATRARPETSRSHPLFACYEGLVTRLRSTIGWPDGAPQAIGITSFGQGQGVSTIASNLAVAAHVIGHRIVLVNAHLAHPSIAGAMAIPPSPGVSDYLGGTASLAECLHDHSQETPTIMPAGSPPSGPLLVPETASTSELVAALRNEFGLIIVDLPPLKEVVRGPALAAQLDGVLLVLAAKRYNAAEAERAIEQLRQAGVSRGSLLCPHDRLCVD